MDKSRSGRSCTEKLGVVAPSTFQLLPRRKFDVHGSEVGQSEFQTHTSPTPHSPSLGISLSLLPTPTSRMSGYNVLIVLVAAILLAAFSWTITPRGKHQT